LISLLLLIISNIIPLSYPRAIIQEISLSCPKRQFITRTSFNLLEGNLFDENSFNPPQRQFILGNSNDPGNLFAEIPLTSLKAIKILN
jgi:hypothetical protein